MTDSALRTECERSHLYLVTSHPNDAYVGLVESREKPYEMAQKNRETRISKLNVETGESFGQLVVGLGYHDFDSDDPDPELFSRVAKEKLAEIDAAHLEKAGMDPEEYQG